MKNQLISISMKKPLLIFKHTGQCHALVCLDASFPNGTLTNKHFKL